LRFTFAAFMRKTTSFLIAFFIVPALLFARTTSSQAQNVFHGCPPEGSATARTKTDPELNKLKNRIDIPTSFKEMSFNTLVHLAIPKGVSKRHRTYWPSKDLGQVQAQEKKAIRVEGYLIGAKEAEIESCNCYVQSDRDFHIWLGGSANDIKSEAVVTEVTPRIRASHPSWRLRILKKLAKAHAKVRISGWLMLDPEHPEQRGRTRATLWEIHPVLKLEVQGVGGWREL